MASSSLTFRTLYPRPPMAVHPSPSFSPTAATSLSSFSLQRRESRGLTMAAPAAAGRGLIPPVDLSDPFISGLASAASTCPELLDFPPSSFEEPGFLPYLDIAASASLMPSLSKKSLMVARPTDANRFLTSPPPDLESRLLFARVVYVAYPLVPIVSELTIAELLYLQAMDPDLPIYMYINSTGTASDDGEPVALESDGFAVYDIMSTLTNEIHTVAIGMAMGHACLLLAAGTKGKRYMMPNSQVMIQEAKMPAYGDMQASDLVSRTREALIERNTFIELMAKHTGNSFETIDEVIRKPFYMDCHKAKEFGVIDKIPTKGEKLMADVPSRVEWDRRAKARRSIRH